MANSAPGTQLHHVTFEEPEELLDRMRRQGWRGTINSAERLASKYGVADFHQAQIIASK